jgi:hypothetical protein
MSRKANARANKISTVKTAKEVARFRKKNLQIPTPKEAQLFLVERLPA